MTVSEIVNQAVAHHRAGRLREAELLYRQALQMAPNHPAALHYLGSLALRAGRLEDAVQLMARSLELAPQMADFRHNYAMALRQAGRVEEAIEQWRHMLTLRPDAAVARENIGASLHSLGRITEAIEEYRAALTLKDDADGVWHNLGLALMESGELSGALECFDRVLARRPATAATHNARGNALRRLERFDEAIAAYQRTIELAPKHVEPHVGLGNVLKDIHRCEEAVAAYQAALAIDPAAVPVHNNMGMALQKLGRWDDALACYDRAAALRPDHAESHWNRSIVLLLKGDLERGLPEHEWRFKCRDFPGGQRFLDSPPWGGLDLPQRAQRGAEARTEDLRVGISDSEAIPATRRSFDAPVAMTILLHAEQGLGDTVQFVRYAAEMKRGGYRVVVESPTELVDLLRTMKEIDEVVAKGRTLPPFDAHAPMLSLPLLMHTRLETIPADVPYLRADAGEVEKWRRRFAGDGPAVGLVWAGSPRHPNDRHRSVRLEALGPVLAVPGVRFFSLQKGPARDQLVEIAGVAHISDITDDLSNLTDTAAAVTALDLVLSVDTLMAHLAGALGRPVWTLLPFDPDWRWMLDRDDSPWYPTMRLWRQTKAGDWAGVMARVAAGLRDLTVGG